MPLIFDNNFNHKNFGRIILLGLVCFMWAYPVKAGRLEDLKNLIFNRQTEKQKIDEDIKKYQQQLSETAAQKRSLSNEIKQIEGTRQQLSSNIKSTEKNISQSNKTLSKLSQELKVNQDKTELSRATLANTLRQIRNIPIDNLIELALSSLRLSDLLSQTEELEKIQAELGDNLEELRDYKYQLENKTVQEKREKSNLENLKSKLADQKKLVEETKKEKDQLLSVTKNKESNYQKLLAERLKRKQQVEKELTQYEEEIKVIVNPSLLPKTTAGILRWPLDKIVITQYFGNTSFASKNPQVYVSGTHNGVDFGASVGTPVLASESGVVAGAGNTDLTCAGASYGKWIMLKHNNGLSSLYAHLSLIKVSQGQTVTRGEIIGYSGNTGYSTGPHLHYTVYASEGVKISTLKSKVPGCGTYILPISIGGVKSYLNPLSYLGD